MAGKEVNEKSLELNVGAEVLEMMRQRWPRTLLTGLTQKQEKEQGVDSFVEIFKNARVFAFQFKAPELPTRYPHCVTVPRPRTIFKYTINEPQHSALYELAQRSRPDFVFYVFPFFCCLDKLWFHSPNLARDTWLLPINGRMEPGPLFRGQKSKTVHCEPGTATINPELPMISATDLLQHISKGGIPIRKFAEWYFMTEKGDATQDDSVEKHKHIGEVRFAFVE